jgi:hypothetical protein
LKLDVVLFALPDCWRKTNNSIIHHVDSITFLDSWRKKNNSEHMWNTKVNFEERKSIQQVSHKFVPFQGIYMKYYNTQTFSTHWLITTLALTCSHGYNTEQNKNIVNVQNRKHWKIET